MSAKWVRSQRWDDEHLTGVLWPLKVVLRLFSWISTAVVLLTLVALYGILASVPIGLIAEVPTWGVYGLTVLATVGVVALLPVWGITRALRARGVGLPGRFTVAVIGMIALGVAAVWAWYRVAWPHLRWDARAGTGLMFFADFVERYRSVQFRRLPGVEMSELEFYSWWPLTLVLVLFVVNLVVATVRRIEFTFPRVGVLMVHTGIVVIALGSVYYAGHKQEGDALLLAGAPGDDGAPGPGRAETGFYDNTRVALWVTQGEGRAWEQRPLSGVPRYNDYNLGAVPSAPAPPAGVRDFGPVSVAAPERPAGVQGFVDADLGFRVVGYASYCELEGAWVEPSKAGPAGAGLGPGKKVRVLEVAATQAPEGGGPPPRKQFRLTPEDPAGRVETLDVLAVEYTLGMAEDRWASLSAQLPPSAEHALVVEVPAAGDRPAFRGVYAAVKDQDVPVGDTGYVLKVKELLPAPPFPIVTAGYRGATSSVAIVHVTPPAGAGGGSGAGPGVGFDRWVYHRFPEISQDLLDEVNERGMPKRRDADPGIRIWYVDASVLQVYVDERADGSARILSRFPGGAPGTQGRAVVTERLEPGTPRPIAPSLTVEIKERVDGAVRVEVPRIVPEGMRDKQRVGNHQAAAVAVEVSWGGRGPGERAVRWVPFTQYFGVASMGGDTLRTVDLPDGRRLRLAFGRVRHEFWPPMSVALKDFEMIPYPHSDTPRDYRSHVLVSTRWGETYKDEVRVTSLNEPLLVRTPYVPPEGVPLPGRLIGRLMSVIAPNQYKFSQAGWDQAGWRETAAAAERGEAPRPSARFTILGVGTNPGIYIIATGAVLMSVGIPWAFYLKPWLVKRESRKLRERLEREGRAGGAGRTIAADGPAGTNGTHAPAAERAGTQS